MPKNASKRTSTTSLPSEPKPPRIQIKGTRGKAPKKKAKVPVVYRAPAAPFRLLALDQSTRKTGWSVIDVVQGGVMLVEYGVLDVERDDQKKHLDMDQRVPFFSAKISAMIDFFKPQAVACEMPFVGRNFDTAGKLFRCFGAVEAIASLRGLPFYYCSPDEAKEFVLRGVPNWRKLPGESKVLVKSVLANQFKTSFCFPLGGPKGEDICDDSDATAVGLRCLYAIIGPSQAA